MSERSGDQLRPRRSTQVLRSSSLEPQVQPSAQTPLPQLESPPPSSPVLRISSICTIRAPPRLGPDVVISRIEHLVAPVIDRVAEGRGVVFLPYCSRTTANNPAHRDGDVWPGQNPQVEGVRFPARNVSEARHFARVMRVLELCHQALLTGDVLTKRNIYYQNKELFGDRQDALDKLIDDIAYTLGVGREDLNIAAAAKGLISGPIELIMRNGEKTECGDSQDGILLPRIQFVEMCDFRLATWLLIIEKEATFRTLAHARYHTKSEAGQGVLITAKGFPDLATRRFISILHGARPQLKVFALVDFDPDGIAIFRNYKYGSRSLSHEENVTVPQAQWIGIKSDDVLERGYGLQGIDDSPQERSQGNMSQETRIRNMEPEDLIGQQDEVGPRTRIRNTNSYDPFDSVLPLTQRDRKKAVDVLEEIAASEEESPEILEQKLELQRILMLNIKAEMQAVDCCGNITEWLDRSLRNV